MDKDTPKFMVEWIRRWDRLSETEKLVIHSGLVGAPVLALLIAFVMRLPPILMFTLPVWVLSISALIYSFEVLIFIMKKDKGSEEMFQVAKTILEGSEGFFMSQYGTIFKMSFLFAASIFTLYILKDNKPIIDALNGSVSNLSLAIFAAVSFMLGAFSSACSGYAGMWVSVRANVRVAAAATRCYNDSIQIAFKGGFFGAIINIALAIFSISSVYILCYFYMSLTLESTLIKVDKIPLLLIGFGFGASFVAMFAQLGGGIYTKAADVGADLIGKIEAGIPEDDPRNPAVIADLVGDNVGDCAGQAADLFESITAEIISAMILGAVLADESGMEMSLKVGFMMFPFALHSLDLIASSIGEMFVATKKGLPDFDPSYGEMEDPLDIMKRGYRVAMLVGVLGFFIICFLFLNNGKGSWIFFALSGTVGMVVSYLFIEITQYYTDYNYGPVQSIVQASKTGHATNIIAGLSVGMESTGLPVILISIGILGSYYFGEASGITNSEGVPIGGLYGTAIATMGMFTTGVFVLSMSGFGPIADNAGGIAEMSHQQHFVRKVTDRLDAVGNVTKANAKGYSVGSASLACFLLFTAFIDEVNFISPKKFQVVDITKPEVFVGGLIGSMTVFVFSSWAIRAVGNAAQDVIKEVQRQFRDSGILEGTKEPDYFTCVAIVSKAGLREMVKPGLLSVLSPIMVGLIFTNLGKLYGKELLGAKVMCAYLMFSTSTGILMALFLNNGGGAWDNAKKYVETGAAGGKNSETHKATVTGDTVGDPCKDTAGPSIHILIKLLSTITLVLTPLFID